MQLITGVSHRSERYVLILERDKAPPLRLFFNRRVDRDTYAEQLLDLDDAPADPIPPEESEHGNR